MRQTAMKASTDSRVHTALIHQKLLNWYDNHGRDLPWRVHPRDRRPGERPDPYSVWVAEVLLQQTTVAVVKRRFGGFVRRWPTVANLASAGDHEVMAVWAGLGYYARARNMLRCARTLVDEFGGVFPEDTDTLEKLPGIGPYTAAAISAIAFGRPAAAVDGNVERVMARLFAVTGPLPGSKPQLRGLAADLVPQNRPGDWAQALMDLGATVCRPQGPACAICPIESDCAAVSAGLANELPRRRARPPRQVKRGVLYVGRRADGAWLLERRPADGLFGGMLGWPGSGWETASQLPPPCEGDWRKAGQVRHTLTHLELRMVVKTADLPLAAAPARGGFVDRLDFSTDDLPSLMRKAFAAARGIGPD